jgi:hypothetical protein
MRGISLRTELKQPDETTFHPQIFGVKPAISGAVAQDWAFEPISTLCCQLMGAFSGQKTGSQQVRI